MLSPLLTPPRRDDYRRDLWCPQEVCDVPLQPNRKRLWCGNDEPCRHIRASLYGADRRSAVSRAGRFRRLVRRRRTTGSDAYGARHTHDVGVQAMVSGAIEADALVSWSEDPGGIRPPGSFRVHRAKAGTCDWYYLAFWCWPVALRLRPVLEPVVWR